MSVTDTTFNPGGNPLVGDIKQAANALAEAIERVPPGRRRAVALENLETASMWAVKAAVVGDE
jgi:hypothetical protein